MKLVRTPLRISLIGGGSDIPSHYERHGGAVVSFTIDKYIYITAKKEMSLFPHKYRLVYSDVETANKVEDIKHPIIKSLIKQYNLQSLDLDVMSDVPAGTGLGSSSAFTVGLHNALSHDASNYELAYLACKTEIDNLKEPIGKQDQYAAAFGGLNLLTFNQNATSVRPICMDEYNLSKFTKQFVLIYVGGQRSASTQLHSHNLDPIILNDMRDYAFGLNEDLLDLNFDLIGYFVQRGWELKKRLSDNITNPRVDAIISTAIKNGATGGKLLGAGGAGFVLLVWPPKDRRKIKDCLAPFNPIYVPFTIDTEGSKVLYETPNL